MATTAVVSLPLVFRASFLFSGMFGIRLEGFKDHNGQPIAIESAIPVNFTVPTVINENSQEFTQQTSFNGSENRRCISDCVPVYHNKTSSTTSSNNITSETSKNKESNSGLSTPLPQLSVRNKAKTYALEKPCGPGRCSLDEICVSWMKQPSLNKQKFFTSSRHESPMMVHECLPNDGIHWRKMNPTGARLCENGSTHSIILKQSRKLCSGTPNNEQDHKSCEIIWNYLCVDEKESPHSCSLRKCPLKGTCIEVKNCDNKQLCYVKAICRTEPVK